MIEWTRRVDGTYAAYVGHLELRVAQHEYIAAWRWWVATTSRVLVEGESVSYACGKQAARRAVVSIVAEMRRGLERKTRVLVRRHR